MQSFGIRLQSVFAEYGQLCLGIDAHQEVLDFHGLKADASGVEKFARDTIAAACGKVGVIKPQVAFFERFGSAGYQALERTIADAKSAGLLVIADIKRAEIGSSMRGYAEAWFAKDSALRVDAITVNPFLGVGSLISTFDYARMHNAGIFVLAATSNPEAKALQQLGEPSVTKQVITQIQEYLGTHSESLADIGVVIGASNVLSDYQIKLTDLTGLPILAPGFGHQGAKLCSLGKVFGTVSNQVLLNQSRSLNLLPYKELPAVLAKAAAKIRETID